MAKNHLKKLQVPQNKFWRIVLNRTEAKVPSIEEYVGKLQANFNIRLAAQNSV